MPKKTKLPKAIKATLTEVDLVKEQELEKLYFLPRTLEEFDVLNKAVCKAYGFGDERLTANAIAVAIMHLPTGQGTCSIKHFGHTIIKTYAYHVSNHIDRTLRHENKVTDLKSKLQANINDFQSRDELQKEADVGSPEAKAVLVEFFGEYVPTKVEKKTETSTSLAI